jgi:hypothetical protein
MAETYHDELLIARDRTIRMGLTCPTIPSVQKELILPGAAAGLPKAMFDAVGTLTNADLVAQCFSIHDRLRLPLERFLKVPILYTLGYVHTPPVDRFRQTEEQLVALLKTGLDSRAVNLHVWLTLPTMEILDISLATSMAVANNWTSGHGSAISGHADRLNSGMRYHPMLIGEDFLRKIGGLLEFRI